MMFLQIKRKKQHLSILKTSKFYTTTFHSEKKTPNRIDQIDPHMTELVRVGSSFFGQR